ncbi:MAG: PAS domain S-box protein [Promethearchaeota archaeon]|nr:MAG: PAS domain S-box protein [Candidatus Lokiarchaeota archaeon]
MMKTVQKYIEEQIKNNTKQSIGLNEISADLNMTKKEASRELLQFLEDTLKAHPDGLTITDLKDFTKLNRNWIAKQLEILEIMGRLDLKTIGPAKLYKYSADGLNQWDKYYRALIENAHDVVLVVKKEAEKSMHIAFMSDNIELMTGFPAHLIDKTLILAHIHPGDRTVIDSLNRIFADESHQDSINFRFMAKDGQYLQLEAHITDLRDDSEIGGLVLNCQDVTENFNLEERIQYRMAFGQMMLNIATSLITTPEEELLVRFNTNFESIGKFMHPMDHLQNLNFVADYLFLFLLSEDKESLVRIKQWKNPDHELPEMLGFNQISIAKNHALSDKVIQNEPFFVPDIQTLQMDFDESIRKYIEPLAERSLLMIPFRSLHFEFTGALSIIFHSQIQRSIANHFLDMFQSLVEIVRSHLERMLQTSTITLVDLMP